MLVEKPIASNAEEAAQMQQESEKSGLVLMEAFHYRYHPLMTRIKVVIVGTINFVDLSQYRKEFQNQQSLLILLTKCRTYWTVVKLAQ